MKMFICQITQCERCESFHLNMNDIVVSHFSLLISKLTVSRYTEYDTASLSPPRVRPGQKNQRSQRQRNRAPLPSTRTLGGGGRDGNGKGGT